MTTLALVLVAVVAYQIGSHDGVVTNDAAAGRVWRWGWFPGGFWFFILMFWVFGGLRRMWWGPRWGYGYYRPWRYDRYDPYDDRRGWEEWHRREHERMSGGRGSTGSSAPPASASPGDRHPIT